MPIDPKAMCRELTKSLIAANTEITAQAETIQRQRDALLRNRRGYLNILEMRKLDSEKWGQRDGYGGRYGALTRDEIEGVIAEIDAALADQPAAKCATCQENG